jgi:glycosyltransferase involved in cell wall biosynthesis
MNVGQTYPLGVAVVAAGKMYGIRTVLRITEDYLAESKIEGTIIKKIWRRLFHGTFLHYAVYRQADTIVPLGRLLARRIVRAGIDESKVKPIPQPFDIKLFERKPGVTKKEYKRELGLEPDRKTILNVGRLSWGKGADRVLEIARRVTEISSDRFQFCLVGDGPYVDSFSSLPSKSVHTAGYVDREKVHKYFQAADLLIHPSRRDLLPNVILEAIAAGVPIIASPIGEIPNYVGTTSYRVGDYVQYILRQEWEREEKPEWFDIDHQKNIYYKLFSGLLT